RSHLRSSSRATIRFSGSTAWNCLSALFASYAAFSTCSCHECLSTSLSACHCSSIRWSASSPAGLNDLQKHGDDGLVDALASNRLAITSANLVASSHTPILHRPGEPARNDGHHS